MKSAKTLKIASSRARCYSFTCSKTSLPPRSQTASELTANSPICLIYNQRPICTNFYSRERKNTFNTRRYLSTGRDENDSLRRTALYDLHVENKATMVPFGGYSMPVRYADLTISESHHWTRNKASLFDVGHMYGVTSLFVDFGEKRLNPTELGSNTTSGDTVQGIFSQE